MHVENKSDLKSVLKEYINADVKGVYLYTVETELVKRIIKDVWEEVGSNVVMCGYDVDNGLSAINDFPPIKKALSNDEIRDKYKDIKRAMSYIINLAKEQYKNHFFIVVFNELTEKLNLNEEFRQALYNSLIELNRLGVFCYFISTRAIVPEVIDKMVFYIDVPLPTSDEIKVILEEKIRGRNATVSGESIKERVTNALNGLTEDEISNIINLILGDGELNEKDVYYIGYMKRQLIRKSGVLDFVITNENMEDVGGFERLKEWMKRKKKIIDDIEKARKFGVDIPKGILLLGMPGCGKSLCAKAISRYMGVPLLRLDMGMILGQYLGQSEENIRKAIKQAESISPCVLWIDEIEKALVGVGGEGSGGQVTTRIFGSLLTWMQEKTKMVFVVATANKIESIPPEFLRKGRFDEIFFVNFPQEKERLQILDIHLRKRGKGYWKEKMDINYIIKNTDGYTGADIEALVSLLVEECYYRDLQQPDNDYVVELLKKFKPLKESMKEEIDSLEKAHKKYNFIDVNN